MPVNFLNSGTEPYSDDVKARFSRMNFRQLAADVGAKSDPDIAEFSTSLKQVMDLFLAGQYSPPVPKRHVAKAEFARLQRPANKLREALADLENRDSFFGWAFQNGYEANFPLDDEIPAADDPLEGLSAFERDYEALTGLLAKFSHVITDLLQDTDPGGAGAMKDVATYDAVHGLAGLYEQFAGVSASRGFTKLKDPPKFDGPFFCSWTPVCRSLHLNITGEIHHSEISLPARSKSIFAKNKFYIFSEITISCAP